MLLASHWHPDGRSQVTIPHFHVGGTLGGIPFAKLYAPTGPITLLDVLRFAIVELGVEPRRGDWREVLDAAAGEAPR